MSLTRRRDTRDYAIREVPPEEAGPVLKRYLRIAPATRPYFQATKDSRPGTSSPRRTATPYSNSHQPVRIANLATLDADGANVACCGTSGHAR